MWRSDASHGGARQDMGHGGASHGGATHASNGGASNRGASHRGAGLWSYAMRTMGWFREQGHSSRGVPPLETPLKAATLTNN